MGKIVLIVTASADDASLLDHGACLSILFTRIAYFYWGKKGRDRDRGAWLQGKPKAGCREIFRFAWSVLCIKLDFLYNGLDRDALREVVRAT
jgi:hypothetical protein